MHADAVGVVDGNEALGGEAAALADVRGARETGGGAEHAVKGDGGVGHTDGANNLSGVEMG